MSQRGFRICDVEKFIGVSLKTFFSLTNERDEQGLNTDDGWDGILRYRETETRAPNPLRY